ncbi:hypothetical protein DSO57_1003405 [Entomophthora muscae]|uniref:Uncharacterized protein n=1 Tax=Entomophthora muscae TaxID=34485 RepID=A0ACC2TJT1_9FUNG|nr:hypothetical protein DSO57_1003405 [Entomophthora muscae]
MSTHNLQPFNQLACGANPALCQGVPLARRTPPAIKLAAQNQKVTAAKSNITDTTKAKPGKLNNDVNKIDGEAKKDFKPALKTDDGSGPEDGDDHKADEDMSEEEKDAYQEDELNAESKLSSAGKLKVHSPTHSPQPGPPPDSNKKPEPKPDLSKKPESKPDAKKKKPEPKLDANKNKPNDTQARYEKKPLQDSRGDKPTTLPSKPQQKRKCLPNRRKEIRELKPEELKAYIDAIKTLHKKQKPDQPSKFDKYAATHVKQHKYIHGVPAFLPWHRQFIRNYELELQKINPAVTLPYWDWTIDSQEPHNSPVLSSAMFGGNGNSAEDMCVTDGPFAHWMVTTPSPHCLRRDYADGKSVPPLTPIDVMSGIISDTKEYEDFVFDLEVHHGPLHLDVGGERGDLNPMHSPNDPLFFLHHTFIDMVWYNWQMKHPNSKAYGGKAEGRAVSMNDKLEPFNVTVKDVINTRSPGLCYFYDPYHPKVASLKKRTGFSFETLSTQNLTRGVVPNPDNKEALKPVQHLPEAWLRMNNLDVNRVREVEKERDTATNNLNALGVTPASR